MKRNEWRLRTFVESDVGPIVDLFYETVHSVNKRDYTAEQLHVWAAPEEKPLLADKWLPSLSGNIAYTAVIGDRIVGFSDLERGGYLNRLFVHKDYQGRGIASALAGALEAEARALRLAAIDTDASITAMPFFLRQGYVVIAAQTVERRGVQLSNYKMRKTLL